MIQNNKQLNLFQTLEKKIKGDGKRCTKCKEYLPLSSFTMASGANFRRPECKTCTNKMANLLKDFRVEYPKPKKGYKCPICNCEEYEMGQKVKVSCWVLDHCHKTDTFRGYLCANCNKLLGYARDNPKMLRRAIKYLKGELNVEQ